MKQDIDILIINNVPAFYKVNLYNELAKRCRLHVVFIGLTKETVISDSFQNEIHFSYDLINSLQIEMRKKIKTFRQIFKIVNKYNYTKIIYGGYSEVENIILMFLFKKNKNCLQFESSIHESKISGLKAYIKKLIFNRISIALPSGKLNADVFKALSFKGKIITTGGVGIFHKPTIEKKTYTYERTDSFNYIYVGRLIPVKNVDFIISVFNKTGKHLTIVGTGYLEKELRNKANSNVIFKGFVQNEFVHKEYMKNDIFILPSVSEPWGLVVEEAIYCGTPVLVSNKVGCSEDIVVCPKTGITFSPYNEDDLITAMNKLEKNINFYRNNCLQFDFEKRDFKQVNAYLEALNF